MQIESNVFELVYVYNVFVAEMLFACEESLIQDCCYLLGNVFVLDNVLDK